MRLLRRTVCLYFDSCCVRQRIATPPEPQQSSTLLFSLSIYFFQYVKERFAWFIRFLVHLFISITNELVNQ